MDAHRCRWLDFWVLDGRATGLPILFLCDGAQPEAFLSYNISPGVVSQSLAIAAMAGLRLQNRFAFLDDQSPRDDDAVAMQRQERRQAPSWDDPPGSVEQASTDLKASYQRKHRIDTPLGFDDTGELWQWYDHHASQTCKAAPQYSCQVSNGALQVGQVDLAKLLAKLSLFADKWIPSSTVWLH